MKKVSLLGFILSATAATLASAEPNVCPKAFQGFHIGGNIGYGVGFGKQSITDFDASGPTTNTFSNRIGFKGVDGGIGTGYLHRFGHWGLGIAFDANWTNTKGQHSATSTTEPVTRRVVGSARLQNSLDLYGKLGYVLCGEQVMPFIGLGWQNAKWKHNATRSQTGEEDFPVNGHRRLNAFLWKVGVDFLATKHVVVGFEYTGSEGNRKRRTLTDDVTGDTLTTSFKPQYNKFALTARVVY